MLKNLFSSKKSVEDVIIEYKEPTVFEKIDLYRNNKLSKELCSYFSSLQEKAIMDIKYRERVRTEVINLCHLLMSQTFHFIRSLSLELHRRLQGDVRISCGIDKEIITIAINELSDGSHNLPNVNSFNYNWDSWLVKIEITRAIVTLHTIDQLTRGQFHCFDLQSLIKLMPDLKSILSSEEYVLNMS